MFLKYYKYLENVWHTVKRGYKLDMQCDFNYVKYTYIETEGKTRKISEKG